MLGNYGAADELNVAMCELLKPEAENGNFEPKFLYSYAVVNEVIGDPCLAAYREIILQRPEYLAGHLFLFNAMKKQNKNLELAEGHELPELAKFFNEISSEDIFMEKLKNTMLMNKQEMNKYIEVVKKQTVE